MSPRRSRAVRPVHLVAFVAVGLTLATGGLLACADAVTSGTTTPGDEAGTDGSSRPDGAIADEDGSATGTDAGDGGVPAIIDGPGEAGAECAFNRECNAALRCECSETSGCACKAGARGTGQNGITPCTDGNGCASSVCTEGPPDAGSFCSDECKTSADCTGKLPLCSDIAFVGRICIRTPPL
jgi:hypothetical protein